MTFSLPLLLVLACAAPAATDGASAVIGEASTAIEKPATYDGARNRPAHPVLARPADLRDAVAPITTQAGRPIRLDGSPELPAPGRSLWAATADEVARARTGAKARLTAPLRACLGGCAGLGLGFALAYALSRLLNR